MKKHSNENGVVMSIFTDLIEQKVLEPLAQ